MARGKGRRARRKERRARGWGYERMDIKRTLIKRDGGICQLCSGASRLENLTLDHIIPSSRGGSDDITNLQLAHEWCNNLKGDMMPAEFENLRATIVTNLTVA